MNPSTENQTGQQTNLILDKFNGSSPRILVVEDEASIQKSIQRTLKFRQYENEAAYSAEEARMLCRKKKFEVVLCDNALPGESGLSLIRWMAENCPETAAIMVTGSDDLSMAEQALKCGAHDYLVKPFSNRDLLISIAGALKGREKQIGFKESTLRLQEEVSLRTMELARTNARLKATVHGVIKAMAAALECRDPYTAGHQQRVAELSVVIGNRMQLEDDRIQAIHVAAMVHDIGKISIPAEILSKPGVLTEIEFSLIKTHAETGYRILKEIDFPWPIAEIVHQHHERVDGSGYPNGLRENELTLEARIIMVADVVEAMASHRPYRPALGIQAALEEITDKKDRLFSSDVVDACQEVFESNEYEFYPGGFFTNNGSGICVG